MRRSSMFHQHPVVDSLGIISPDYVDYLLFLKDMSQYGK
jgi:hypothetical protein